MSGLHPDFGSKSSTGAGCSRTHHCPAHGEEECGRPATDHVIWGNEDDGKAFRSSMSCGVHADEIRQHWAFLGMHPFAPTCAEPGSLYLPDLNVCVTTLEAVDGEAWDEWPGSAEAVAAGCTCPTVDNNHGLYSPVPPDGWVIQVGCPLHAPC